MVDYRIIVIVLIILGAILIAGVAVMAFGRVTPERGPNFVMRHRTAVLTTAFILIAAIVSFSGYFSSHG